MSKKRPWRSFIWFSSSCAASVDSDGREGLHLGVWRGSVSAGGEAQWEPFGTEKGTEPREWKSSEPCQGEPVAPPTPTPQPRPPLAGGHPQPHFFSTKASSWSRFFWREMELVQLSWSLVSSSNFRRYRRCVS